MISGSEVLGRGRRKIITLTADTTIKGNHDIYLVDATAGNVTITLPDSKAINSQEIVIKKTDSSGNTVTIVGTASQTIDGNANVVLSSQGSTLQIIADGSNFVQTVASASGSFTGGTITGATTVSVANAGAFVVGPNGATNPALKIDTSVASAVNGLQIQGTASGGNVQVTVISGGAADGLIFITKGAGGIGLQPGTNGTAAVNVNNAAGQRILRVDTTNSRVSIGANVAAPANTLDVYGVVAVALGTAIPAGGSSSVKILMSSTANFGIYAGSGAPTVSAAQGSIYLRTDGTSTSTRLYVNTDGATTWTNVTTAT